MSERSYATSIPKFSFFKRKNGADKIGVVCPSYGLERVSYLIQTPKYEYIKLPRIPLQLFDFNSNYFDQTPIICGNKNVLLHCFNRIPRNRKFVTSVEMELPRFFGKQNKNRLKTGLDLLNGDNCRGIWPLSETAKLYLERRFESYGYTALKRKLSVFKGVVPDSPGIKEYNQKTNLRLLFIGGDGLRKGLRPSLEAAIELRRRGIEIEITIVGNATSHTYIVPGVTFETEFLEKLKRANTWIKHYSSISNRKVRQLMKSHDILLFPTMDESLGWVVAEAAMDGTPAISTDIFAIPELVKNNHTGWLISIPKNEEGRWEYIGRKSVFSEWQSIQEYIKEELIRILSNISNDISIIEIYGKNAKKFTEANYNIDSARKKLLELYDSIK